MSATTKRHRWARNYMYAERGTNVYPCADCDAELGMRQNLSGVERFRARAGDPWTRHRPPCIKKETAS